MTRIGIGLRKEIARWIHQHPSEVECLEITAEHFFDGPFDRLQELRTQFPLYVHGLGLSLGTPGPLDPEVLENFCRVVEAAQPEWVSEHLSLTRTHEVDLGHLNPVAPSHSNLQMFAEHVRELQAATGCPVILENITTELRLAGDLSETEFVNRLCEEAECGLLLDVTNLYINSRNHGFDPREWLHELQPDVIKQLHVIGYMEHNGHYHDTHSRPIQDDLLELIGEVCSYGSVSVVTLEWDTDFPEPEVLVNELRKLKEVCRADAEQSSSR